jgi:RNA polymerase sigma-70 factor, ECF subfamily
MVNGANRTPSANVSTVDDRLASLPDATLVRAVADGSQDALAALYDRHADGIFAAAVRLSGDRGVAEEVVQETFLALWNRAELFDPGTASLGSWLHAIGRNRTVDRLRAAGRRPNLVPISATAPDDQNEGDVLDRLAFQGGIVGGARPSLDPESAADAAEVQATLRDAIAAMPEVERLVILLAYQEELSQSEIAERLGWPLGTVKTRTRRALARLRDALGERLGPHASLEAVPVPAVDR